MLQINGNITHWTHYEKSYQMPNFKKILNSSQKKIGADIQPNQHYHCKKIRWLAGLSPLWLAMCVLLWILPIRMWTLPKDMWSWTAALTFSQCASSWHTEAFNFTMYYMPCNTVPLSWHWFYDIWESPGAMDATAQGVFICLQMRTLWNWCNQAPNPMATCSLETSLL